MKFHQHWWSSAVGAGACFALALLAQLGDLGAPVEALVLALGVVAAATRYGLRGGLVSAVAAVLVFNFFFTMPFYTLLVEDPRNFVVFGLLLALGTVVGLLTDQLRTRTREAQAALLLQGLSHDWRTPLAVIAGTASTLSQTAAARLEPTEKDRLKAMEREALDLGRQVETVLALVELEGRAVRLEWVPAEDLLRSCVERFAQWRPDRAVRLEPVPGLPLVKVEPSLVERALLNLLDNAERYSTAPIDVGLTATPRSVEFLVYDRGPGVADADKRRIFDKFQRGPGAAGTTRRGSGLGLALVQAVAALHGGEAGVRDREGGGSVFWLRLPVVEGAPEQP